MKEKIKYLLMALMTMTFTVSAGNLVMVEGAIESEALSIKMSKDLTGIIRGQVCQRCETIITRITPDTKLYVNGEEVALSKALSMSGAAGTAFFDLKTKNVTKIRISK